MLEIAILVAEDKLSVARKALANANLQADDTLAATILRYLDWKSGECESTWAPDTADYLAIPIGGKMICRILSLCVSAALAFERLQLSVSANLATEALQLARVRYGNNAPISALPAVLLAHVAYEQGRRDEAEALLRPRISVIRSAGMMECVARATVLLSRIALHRGRPRAALAILREAEALGRIRCWPRLVSIASTEYTRALEAVRFDEQQLAKSRLAARRGCTIHAADRPTIPGITRPGNEPTVPTEVTYAAVEAELQRAVTLAVLGATEDVNELLLANLRIGATRGLCMAFVDAGRPLLQSLERLYYTLPTSDPELADLRPYLATLLRATVPTNPDSVATSYRSLSGRETGILKMIASGMSNKRIAQSLGITPETVKSHAKSILIKLASNTRAQAVARAEAVGFL